VLYDKRMAITVQSEFGIPIFALRGMREWKKKYDTWMLDWRARGEAPPHVDKRWLQDVLGWTLNGAAGPDDSGVLPVLEPNDDDKIQQSFLRFLVMGGYVRDHAPGGNGRTDIAKRRNARGVTFEAFCNEMVKGWPDGDVQEGTPRVRPVGDGNIEGRTSDMFSSLKTYYEGFREGVSKPPAWPLGEIASFWDAFMEEQSFQHYHKEKKTELMTLCRILNRSYMPAEEELARLADSLGGVIRINTLDNVTYPPRDTDFLSNFALAVSRM
jgi:hypothetical protein